MIEIRVEQIRNERRQNKLIKVIKKYEGMFKKNEKGIKRKYIINKLYIDLKKEENIIELIKRDIEYIEIEKKIEVIDLKINESEIRKKILKRIGIGIILRRRGIERI